MRDTVRKLGRTRSIGLAALAAVLLVGIATIAVLAASGGGSDAGADDLEPSPATGTSVSATATPTSTPTITPTPSATPIKHAGILDGVPMSDAEWSARKDVRPLAVMVDNTANASPHAGLDKADLIYEAFVEGGITRLMAVYWRQEADKILPIRSARTPFVVWASELGALYAHAGGAYTNNDANAIGQIAEWGVPDLNAFSDISTNAYYRDTERYGPYDLATSTWDLRDAAAKLGFGGTSAVQPWLFREAGAFVPSGKAAAGIEIDFQGHLYSWQYIQWKWDPATKRYLRFQFGGPEVDAISGTQLGFATVVVMNVPAHVADSVGHVLYDQFGTGPATVFTDGQAYAGTWAKKDRESRTRFYDSSGNEISFERGPVFIEVLDERSSFVSFADAGQLPELPVYEPIPPGYGTVEDEPTAVPMLTPTPLSSPTVNATPTATATRRAANTPPANPSGTAAPTTVTPAPEGSPSSTSTNAPSATATVEQGTSEP